MGNAPSDKNSTAEIESGAEGALEEDIANLSEATGSVADLINSYVDAAISSRATPSDTGISASEIADTDVSSNSTLTINNQGLMQAHSNVWGGGFSQYWETNLGWTGTWAIVDTEDSSGTTHYPMQAHSAGNGDLRYANDDGNTRGVRVVEIA